MRLRDERASTATRCVRLGAQKIQMMFIFFDFLYYGIYKIYNDSNDGSSEFGACCGVSALQTFNILSFVMLYGILVQGSSEINISKLSSVGLIVALIFVNYIRYIQIDKFNHERIKEKLDIYSSKKKGLLRGLLIGYIIISCVSFFGLIAFFATKKM